jgi:hypothetical protein
MWRPKQTPREQVAFLASNNQIMVLSFVRVAFRNSDAAIRQRKSKIVFADQEERLPVEP